MAQILAYLYTESPLHAGAGGGLGTVDLPIQRERHTNLPVVQGSGIKGALRSLALKQAPADEQAAPLHHARVRAVFGPDPHDNPSEFASALTVGDARLLLFPVRSLRGVFAWVTAPLVLKRLQRDVELLTGTPPAWDVPPIGDRDGDGMAALVTDGSAVQLPEGNAVVLEEYTFTVTPSQQADQWARWLGGQLAGLDPWWIERIRAHLVILSDTAFRDFALYATEVVTRVRLEANKTVARGGLWTEESLPADTLLYSPVMTRKPATHAMSDQDALQFVRGVAQGVFQLGGDETVGRGLVRAIWAGAEVAP